MVFTVGSEGCDNLCLWLGCDNLCCSNEEKPPYAPQNPLAVISSPDLAVNEETFLRALSEEDSDDDFAEADPVQDDLYFRRLQQTRRQTSSCPRFDRFLPQYWTPEEQARVHTIYLGSRRRPWYHKMQQLRSVDSFLLCCTAVWCRGSLTNKKPSCASPYSKHARFSEVFLE